LYTFLALPSFCHPHPVLGVPGPRFISVLDLSPSYGCLLQLAKRLVLSDNKVCTPALYTFLALQSSFDLAERLNRFLLSRGTRVQISSWSLKLRFNLSFWTNRGNYHGFNSTIWLYMLSYEPLHV
jgi:hypothetical protein